MSDNNVTMEMVGEELFKILKAEMGSPAEESVTERLEAARLLIEILKRRAQEDVS